MPKRSVFQSTSFRLALTFACLLFIAFVLSGFTVYQLLRSDLSKRLDAAVRETFSDVAATYAGPDLEDLIAAVDNYSELNTNGERLFSLTDPTGKKLAGNFEGRGMRPGFATLPKGTPGLPDGSTFRAYSSLIGGNNLTVALSYAETDRLESLLLLGFGWATLVTSIVAVAGGIWLALRVQRRLDAIAATMMEVSQGNLAARVPLIGSGDDIDGVSAQINSALGRLSALVEGMRQVSADIAHDLKTPLNRLEMILETAIHAVSTGADASADLDDARDECNQINQTFEALLRIAQIEAGARKARFVNVDVDAIVADIVEVYSDVAEDYGKSLSSKVAPGSGHLIQGDRELLTQMFANLVENSLRHTPQDTAIELVVERRGDRIIACVNDNGTGIPPEERDKVFQRLYRLDKSRSTPGSGLGLSLVRAIADLHDATIKLEDRRPGLGVVIIFPGSKPSIARHEKPFDDLTNR
jgi:signal transduction histidine kinase